MMAFGDCFVHRQSKQPIEWLVSLLSTNSDRPVVDATGLKGSYDFASTTAQRSGNPHRPRAQAIRQKFKKVPAYSGQWKSSWDLQLEARKGQMDRIVIDHMERRPLTN